MKVTPFLPLTLRGIPIYRAIKALAFNLPARARQAGHLEFVCHLDFGIWTSVVI